MSDKQNIIDKLDPTKVRCRWCKRFTNKSVAHDWRRIPTDPPYFTCGGKDMVDCGEITGLGSYADDRIETWLPINMAK